MRLSLEHISDAHPYEHFVTTDPPKITGYGAFMTNFRGLNTCDSFSASKPLSAV